MFFTSLVQGLREDFYHPIGLVQIGAIGVTYLIAWLLARKIHHYFDKSIEKVETRMRFIILSPAQFAKLLGYLLWLTLIWFFQVLFKEFTIPANLLQMILNLVGALIVISIASFYIKSTFWSRFVYVVCLAVVFLRIFKLWEPTVKLLASMTIGLGKISISVWGLTEAIIVFIVLWAAACVVNRFIARWLMTSTKLTYSDRTLLQRVIKAATVAVVILTSLRAAGIHMRAIAVTGGAVGLGIGVGLQKIGSNLISGVMLLINKPIRQGDVIACEKSYFGASWGWVTQMGLNYAMSWNMVTVRSIWSCGFGSNDPKNGIHNVKDAILMAVWDNFHANGIEIAFPQRDLHIKSAVPLKIFKDNSQPVVKDSPEVTGNKSDDVEGGIGNAEGGKREQRKGLSAEG